MEWGIDCQTNSVAGSRQSNCISLFLFFVTSLLSDIARALGLLEIEKTVFSGFAGAAGFSGMGMILWNGSRARWVRTKSWTPQKL